jgi:hypothetical protein
MYLFDYHVSLKLHTSKLQKSARVHKRNHRPQIPNRDTLTSICLISHYFIRQISAANLTRSFYHTNVARCQTVTPAGVKLFDWTRWINAITISHSLVDIWAGEERQNCAVTWTDAMCRAVRHIVLSCRMMNTALMWTASVTWQACVSDRISV